MQPAPQTVTLFVDAKRRLDECNAPMGIHRPYAGLVWLAGATKIGGCGEISSGRCAIRLDRTSVGLIATQDPDFLVDALGADPLKMRRGRSGRVELWSDDRQVFRVVNHQWVANAPNLLDVTYAFDPGVPPDGGLLFDWSIYVPENVRVLSTNAGRKHVYGDMTLLGWSQQIDHDERFQARLSVRTTCPRQ